MGRADAGLSHRGAVRGVFDHKSGPGGSGGAAGTLLCPLGWVGGGRGRGDGTGAEGGLEEIEKAEGGWGTAVWESLDDCLEVLDNDISFLSQHNPQALKGLLSHLCASAPAIPGSRALVSWGGSPHAPLSLGCRGQGWFYP